MALFYLFSKNKETGQTLIELLLAIGLASIIAKVTRDAHMVRIARDYPQYSFEIHKGYGTRAHRAALKKHGLSRIHRKTFCGRFR